MVLYILNRKKRELNVRKYDMKHNRIPTLFLFCIALSLVIGSPVFAADIIIDVERDGIQKTGRPEVNDQNDNGIPDEWEKKFKISPGQVSADSDQDSDGFTLIQEYEAKTDPTDPKSHPKYISQVFVSAISRQRITGLELVSVEMKKSDKKDWIADFAVIRNNRKRNEFVRINVGTFKNNDVEFRLLDLEVDEKTKEPVAYIQRVGKDERIPCQVKQPVYAPVIRVKFQDALADRTFTASNDDEFKLGTDQTGEETYKLVSADVKTMEAVVKSVGDPSETITIRPIRPNPDENGASQSEKSE